MMRGTAAVALFAGLMLGTTGVLAQSSGAPSSKTTNTYDESSTSEDISVSCKQVDMHTQVSVTASEKVKANCNKAGSDGTVSTVSTTIEMLDHVTCTSENRVDWGTSSSDPDPVGGFIALTSTGNSYLFRAYCVSADGTRVGPSGVDIGDTTNGLKNDGGSLDKR